jgi:hypothetical protein
VITVSVNDRILDVAAIVERGRVLLPMRAMFTSLGARVSYDPHGRIVVAKRGAHVLRLHVGSLGSRVVAGRVYVPLRYVAQTLGASVNYDGEAHLVAVNAAQTPSAAPVKVRVTGLTPAPQSNSDTAYPVIGASLSGATAATSAVTLVVDGVDVTKSASFDGATISYLPRQGMQIGTHTVSFSGVSLAGTPFSATWSFSSSQAAPPDAPGMTPGQYQFYASGPTVYYPGDYMHFFLVAPSGGSARMQLCNLGYWYPMWNGGNGTTYEGYVPAPMGYWLPSCEVSAVYTDWNGREYYVPMPVFVTIYTAPGPTPRPTATPKPRSAPPNPRRAAPTPTPRHAAPPRAATPPPRAATPPPRAATPKPRSSPTPV